MCFRKSNREGEDYDLRPTRPVTVSPAQGQSHSSGPPGRTTAAGRTGKGPSNQAGRASGTGHGGPSSTAANSGPRDQQRPQRTEKPMTREILNEFLQALSRGFGDLDYAVIGGAALIMHGMDRQTSDIDVMVPEAVSEVVKEQLLERNVGILLTDQRHPCYKASDGLYYGLDITTDKEVSQKLRLKADTVRQQGTNARFVNIVFLLNSKAYAYLTRVGPDAAEKQRKDARDIIFILRHMRRSRTTASSQQCRWVVDYDFWNSFTTSWENQEAALREVGLQRDPTPNQSNRSSRRISSESRTNSDRGSNHGHGQVRR